MHIIVLVKQVPDTSVVKINRETNTLIRDGVPSIINPFDMFAIEEALRLREQHGGKVTAVTMGPPQAADALKEAVAMGVDEVVLLSDRAFAGADTWATSYTLAQGIKKLGPYDLVIAGKQAIDGDTAQVGKELAVPGKDYPLTDGTPIVLGGVGFALVHASRLVSRLPRAAALDRGWDMLQVATAAVVLVLGFVLTGQAMTQVL